MAKAILTLTDLTGISFDTWLDYKDEYEAADSKEAVIENILHKHCKRTLDYNEFDFIITHVTTSTNNCESIRREGLLDLKGSLRSPNSELKQFLEANNVNIDIDGYTLTYNDKVYKIPHSITTSSEQTTTAYLTNIGYKIYTDFAICGMYYMDKLYSGNVHLRPEFLSDIDNLIHKCLSAEWIKSHKPYQITLKVKGKDISYNLECWNDNSYEIPYLKLAYDRAFNISWNDYKLAFLKDGVQVPPNNIEIAPLEF